MAYLDAARISRAPMAALAAVGVFWGTFSAAVPDLKAAAALGDRELGLALVGSSIGGMVSMFLAPRIGARLGRAMLPVAGLGLLLPFLLLTQATGLALFAVSMLAAGLTVALLDISANVRISMLEERHGMHLMNLNHAVFSFAFGGAAFATGLARQAGLGPGVILPAGALVALVLVAAMTEGRGWRGTDTGGGPEGGRLPWLAVGLTAFMLFASFIGENAAEAWSALHIERTLGGPEGAGGFGPSMLGFSMGVIRLTGQGLAKRLGEGRLILFSAILGTVGALGLALAPSIPAALVAVAVMGTGMAVIVPSANSLLGHLVRPEKRALAISRAWLFGFVGYFAGPSAMGWIAGAAGLRVAFVCAAALVALIVPAVLVLMRQQRR